MKLNRRDLWIIVLLLSLIVIFFGQVLFTQATYVLRDFYRTFYPTRYFVSQCVHEGCFPLWNPYLYFGYPFFASLQHGLLNPFSFFIYLFPFDLGIKLFIVFHFFLAGLFMYLLMRDFGTSQIPSLIASLAFTFNSYMLSIDNFTHLTSGCWTPLIFLLFNQTIHSKEKLKFIILTSISLGLQFVGEKPTILYATLLVLILFTMAKIISSKKGERKSILFVLPLIGLISIGLVFIQLIPFIETIPVSYRLSRLIYSQSIRWSLPPLELFTLILPLRSGFMEFLFVGLGQDFVKGIYFGVIPFSLILITFYEKSRRNLFWFGIFLVGIILSLGAYTPFYKLLYQYLPLFSLDRYPVKFFFLSIFAGSILAGFGFDYLLKNIRNKSSIILFISNLVLLLILLIWYLNLGKILGLIKSHYFIPDSLEKLIEIEGKYFMIYQNFFLVTTILSLFNLLIILTKKFIIKLNTFLIASVVIITFDLFFFGLNLNPLVNQRLYHYQPPILKILKKDRNLYRFMIESQTLNYYTSQMMVKTVFQSIKISQLTLIPNSGLMHRISEADGYGFLVLEDYIKFYERLEGFQQLLNLSNVKYIISKFEIPDLKLIYKKEEYGEEFRLYENPTCFPRAFFVPEARIVKDRKDILNILSSPAFDPKKEVILEEGFTVHGSRFTVKEATVKIVDYQPNKVIIKTSGNQTGFLFLSDTYYPGWKAYLDGVPTKIYRANFLFRAIVLPKGTHQVEFVYFPLSFKIGLIGTFGTIILVILIISNRGKKYVRQKG